MSTNGVNGEDTEMSECEGEKVVTMMDVLKEQQEFEEDANAVLGASDDKNCTYSKGYIKRQAIYACLTCCNDAKHDPDKRAGVCLACSLTCHENHDLVELYTKRNFRCDCGNPKFNHPCQYTENKTSLNDENIYNQNFSGLYCTCHRPYPDPDGVEEEMIQCIVCEDWLHSSHLEATVPSPDLYAEMICKTCMDKNDFLYDYSKYAVNGDVDVVDISECDNSKHFNGNTDDMNGVNAEPDKVEVDNAKDTEKLTAVDSSTEAIEEITESDKLEVENSTDTIDKSDGSQKLADNENSIEDMNTSHNNNYENNEPMQADLPITDKNEDENLVTKNTDEENPSEPIKICDENSMVNDLPKDIDSDNTDVNSTTENQLNDNQENKTSSDMTSENESPDNPDAVVSPEQQETLDASNKNDSIADVKENPIDTPQESNGGDVNGDHKTEDTSNKGLSIEEKQDNLTASSDICTDNTEVENLSDILLKDEEIKENKRKLSIEDDGATFDVSVKKPKLRESDCLRPQGGRKMFKGATFWTSHFRQKLCTCNECITMYKDLSVLFLIDPEDTVTAYEVLGKEKTDGSASTQYEKGLEALSSLGRIQQINALTEYNKMRDKLLDFLKSFKDRKEVVKEEDIKAFFAGMKPKREPDGVYFCR